MGTLTNLNGIAQTQIPEDIARDAEVASAIAAHNAADWVHLEYLYRVFVARDRSTQSPPTYVIPTEVTSAIANHAAAVDPHPTYLTQTEADGLYRRSAVALTDADIPAAIARDAEVTSAIANHTTAVDPHPGYLTQTEGDGLYRRNAVALTDADIPAAIARDAEVTNAIANHVATADPHPIYLTQAEGDARYRRSSLAKFRAVPLSTQLITESGKILFQLEQLDTASNFNPELSRITSVGTTHWKIKIGLYLSINTADSTIMVWFRKNNNNSDVTLLGLVQLLPASIFFTIIDMDISLQNGDFIELIMTNDASLTVREDSWIEGDAI